MIISFAKTVDELLSGRKSVTRRIYSEKTIAAWRSCWEQDRMIHKAYSKAPFRGGKFLGWVELTEEPYMEKLADMPEEDLEKEGGMCATLDEFYQLIKATPEQEVMVIRFKFYPDEERYRYRPSNGTEGDLFLSIECADCIKKSTCMIPAYTMSFNTDEEQYPREWVRFREKHGGYGKCIAKQTSRPAKKRAKRAAKGQQSLWGER